MKDAPVGWVLSGGRIGILFLGMVGNILITAVSRLVLRPTQYFDQWVRLAVLVVKRSQRETVSHLH